MLNICRINQLTILFNLILGLVFFGVELSAQDPEAGGGRLSIPAPQVDAVNPDEVNAMLEFVPEVVATVGDQTITGKQVKGVVVPTLTAILSAGSQPPTDEELHALVAQVTGQLVDQQVLFRVCRDNGYEPNYEIADAKIAELKKNAGEKQFESALERQGVTLEQFRQQIANMAAFNQWLQEKVLKTLKVTDEELQEFYDANQDKLIAPAKVEVAHILVELPEDADEMAEAAAHREIEEIQAKLKKGVPFAQLAQMNSDCPSAKSGGRLEPFARGEMVKEFEDAAFALDEGQLSEVVRTSYGLHLIKSIRRIPVKTVPLEECRRELSQKLLNYKLNKTLQQAVESGKKTIDVEVMVKAQ
jgi:peptidyl-prolyl cis-trans isomerase C